MKTVCITLSVLLCLFSCKNNTSEEESRPISANDGFEETAGLESSIPDLEIEKVDTGDEEPSAPKQASIFDVGENYITVDKEYLNAEETRLLETLISNDSGNNNSAMIKADDKSYQVQIHIIKSKLEDRKEQLEAVKDLLELNLTHSSVSKGYERDGKLKLRKFLQQPSGSFVEDMMDLYSFKGRKEGQTALRRLGVASDKNLKPIILDFFEVTEREFEFLKSLPKTEKLSNSLMAKRALDFIPSEELEQHLNSANCSEAFKNTFTYFKLRQKKEPQRFIMNAEKAKAQFYKLNPGWYGEDEDIGITYIDSRRKYIYFPFGAISFADRVISHDLGMPEGSNTEGTLGEPDMALESFTIADPRIGNLGLNGVLTLEFTDNSLTNVNGPDLYVFEMGAIEPTILEISKNGTDWIGVGKIEGGTAMVDIDDFVKPNETFNYIRLTDLATYSALPGADVDAVATIGGALRLNLDSAVLFDTAEFKLKESAAETLEELVKAVMEIPEGTIIVEGHTDNVGSPASNKTLSEKRASEVAKYLKAKLPETYKYNIKGYGESQPIEPNDSEENKQKNRRVEILVLPTI